MKYPENIKEISTLNPDYLGFIFWEKSSRNMNFETIPEIPKSIKKVGVFVNASIQDIISKVNQYQLDIVQLHGNESVTYCKNVKKLGVEVIKVFSIADKFDFTTIKEYVLFVDYFLFDTKGKLPGGNGTTFDWKVLEKYPSQKPFFLSGGIGLDEIDLAKQILKTDLPIYAIDVNSKFEIEAGLKDKEKLDRFKQKINF